MTVLRVSLIALLLSGLLNSAFAVGSFSNAQEERDSLFSLAALVVVYRDWQTVKDGRGHNIGSILVNKENEPVFWARNTSNASDNGSQHGEVRLIENFLNCRKIGKYVKDYTVYTTLEPCAMCTGMMTLTQLTRAVYVQKDPGFGGAHDALVAIKYPRVFEQATPEKLKQKIDLEASYKKYAEKYPDGAITDFLRDESTKVIFSSAESELEAWQKTQFSENQKSLEKVHAFVSAVPGVGGDNYMSENCPH